MLFVRPWDFKLFQYRHTETILQPSTHIATERYGTKTKVSRIMYLTPYYLWCTFFFYVCFLSLDVWPIELILHPSKWILTFRFKSSASAMVFPASLIREGGCVMQWRLLTQRYCAAYKVSALFTLMIYSLHISAKPGLWCDETSQSKRCRSFFLTGTSPRRFPTTANSSRP